MSSYELLELLEYMPERGNFKSAVRGGEYCEEEAIWAQIANELAVLRAAQAPGVKGEQYGSRMYYSPAKLRELIADAEYQEEVRESVYAFATRPAVRPPNEDDDDFDDAEGVG
jgi:hypothetical protein